MQLLWSGLTDKPSLIPYISSLLHFDCRILRSRSSPHFALFSLLPVVKVQQTVTLFSTGPCQNNWRNSIRLTTMMTVLKNSSVNNASFLASLLDIVTKIKY